MIDTADLGARLDQPVVSLRTRPYQYRTSHQVDEVEVDLADGSTRVLLLKHIRRSKLSARARRAKPIFLHDPRREGEAYRVLEGTGLGVPKCYGSTEDWLLIEKVRGVELWQLGDVEAWARSASWVRRMHDLYAGRLPMSDHLLRYDATYFRLWPERALLRHPELGRVAGGYDRIVGLLTQGAPTLIHG